MKPIILPLAAVMRVAEAVVASGLDQTGGESMCRVEFYPDSNEARVVSEDGTQSRFISYED